VRISREALLACLEQAEPALAQPGRAGGIQQGDCFIFLRGRVRTCNEWIALSIPSPFDRELEGAVRADRMLKMLRLMTQEEIEIRTGDGKLTVDAKGDHVGCIMEAEIGMPFPRVPKEPWQPLPEDFCEAVETTGLCIGKEKDRLALTCLHIHPKWLESSDNYQACRWPMKTRVSKPTLLRAESVRHLPKMGVSEFCEEDSWVHFRNSSGAVLSARRCEVDYPDYGVLYEGKGTPIELPKSLKETCAKAGIMTDGKDFEAQVTVELDVGRIKVVGKCIDGYYERDPRKVNYDGPPVKFLVSHTILASIAERHGRCEVTESKLLVDGGKFLYVSCLSVPDEGQERNGREVVDEGEEPEQEPEQGYEEEGTEE
jgi:hypothetical protein